MTSVFVTERGRPIRIYVQVELEDRLQIVRRIRVSFQLFTLGVYTKPVQPLQLIELTGFITRAQAVK